MQIKRIPSHNLTAAVALLSPYCPELSAKGLVGALQRYQTEAPEQPRMIDKHEAARMFDVSWFTLIRWAKNGDVPGAKKIGKQWRFDPDKLLEMSDADKV